jgi:hypothetical protein
MQDEGVTGVHHSTNGGNTACTCLPEAYLLDSGSGSLWPTTTCGTWFPLNWEFSMKTHRFGAACG